MEAWQAECEGSSLNSPEVLGVAPTFPTCADPGSTFETQGRGPTAYRGTQ